MLDSSMRMILYQLLTERWDGVILIGGGGRALVGSAVFKIVEGYCTSGPGGFDSHPLPPQDAA